MGTAGPPIVSARCAGLRSRAGPGFHCQPERDRYPGTDQVRGRGYRDHHRGRPRGEGQGQGRDDRQRVRSTALPASPDQGTRT